MEKEPTLLLLQPKMAMLPPVEKNDRSPSLDKVEAESMHGERRSMNRKEQSAVGLDLRKAYRPWLKKRTRQETRSRLEWKEPLQLRAQWAPPQLNARREKEKIRSTRWWKDFLGAFGQLFRKG